MVYLDLFSGIGGFSLGLTRAGFKFSKHYYSEIDKYAIANYLYNFKNAINIGNIETFSGDGIERPNIITFGFPCQDLSTAGKRGGLSGSRSGLFFEAIRLIEKFKPEIFIFENVKGLLSSNEGEDFETVLRTIANLGVYDCEWQLVNTRWVLPQNRERIYFIGHLRGSSWSRVFPFRESDTEFNERTTNSTIVRTITGGGHSGGHHSGMTLINISGNVGNGHEVDNIYEVDGIAPTVRDNHGKITIVQPILTPNRITKRQNGRRIKNDGEPSFTVTGQDRHGVVITNAQPRTSKLGTGGTGILESNEFSFTISSGSQHYVNHIRRLTEIECERLQGFPDNWTKYCVMNGIIKEVPKTQRYKQLGNAVTVNIVELIGKRLINY